MINKRIIALMTDFSPRDSYIGVMKAVILRINPDVVLVDLAHGISKFNIRKGAFILLSTYKYFPLNTIFLCVIDPGVGTEREGILLRTRNYFFIGPNNGLFSYVAEDDGIVDIIELKNDEYFIKPVSKTFHGRDIFAPVAAYLSLGVPLNKFGKKLKLDRFNRIKVSKPVVQEHYMEGEVIYVDGFGNCVTNILGNALLHYNKGKVLWVTVRGGEKYAARLVETYGEANRDESVILMGSHGFLEISVNRGSASQRFGLVEGDKIKIEVD